MEGAATPPGDLTARRNLLLTLPNLKNSLEIACRSFLAKGLPAHLRDDLKWKPGQSGNPAGRPKGARSILTEDFFRDVQKAWADKGPEVLEDMMREKPADFAKMIASLQSKEITGEDGAALFTGLDVNVKR